MELQVSNSPFNEEQTKLLNQLLPTLTGAQASWLSGYLTALQGTGGIALAAQPQTGAPSAAIPAKEATILFGSQTGNCSGLAKKLSKKLSEQGVNVTLSSMSDFKPANLKKVRNLLIVVSTHGEGEPPDNAISFHEFLLGKRAPKLEGVSFSVLALGDTSYEFFCQTGKDFDQRLEELGGTRIVPRVDCDVDFDEAAAGWIDDVVRKLSEGSAQASAAASLAGTALTETESEYSRTNPFHAEILENINLNGRGSDRETRHLEISLEGSGLQYEPGDSLGIYPENHPQLVDDLIEAMGWNPEESITVNKQGDLLALRKALLQHYEITVLTKPLIKQFAELTSNPGLQELVEPGHEQELKQYIEERDLLDLVQDYQLKGIPAASFASVLRKLLKHACTPSPAARRQRRTKCISRYARFNTKRMAATGTGYAPRSLRKDFSPVIRC